MIHGLPGFIGSSYGFVNLACLISNLFQTEIINVRREYSLQVQDFCRLSIELLIAAKLTRDYSVAEMFNAYYKIATV